MKYLKLFEEHKETFVNIRDLENRYSKEKNDILTNYKYLIDQVMFEVSDYYQTESEFIYENLKSKHYIAYNIVFSSTKYEDFLDKLKEVVERLKSAYDISYKIEELYNLTYTKDIPTRAINTEYPENLHELVRTVKSRRLDESDVHLELRILF
jgi:exonuclease VII small subunit